MEKAYTGKVTNGGAQMVKAPVKADAKKGSATVKKGGDLRTGK